MTDKRKRPRDISQRAKLIVDIATGEVEDKEPDTGKNPAAVALHMMYYNFVRIHSTLRMAPAMAAGVSDRLWEMSDIVKLVEDAEAKPSKRGPYKKRNAN